MNYQCGAHHDGDGDGADNTPRRVSGLEEDLEKTEEKMVAAVSKLDKAGTAADDSERAKKVFQSKADEDEKRIIALEKDLKEAREKAEAADATYDEVNNPYYYHYFDHYYSTFFSCRDFCER